MNEVHCTRNACIAKVHEKYYMTRNAYMAELHGREVHECGTFVQNMGNVHGMYALQKYLYYK